MENELRDLRISKKLPARDMVAVVQRLFPKFDKTVQSKCENSEYGVCIHPKAMEALYAEFAPEIPEARKRRKRDAHRLACRITCRLANAEYEALQQAARADGYATMQELVTALVRGYLSGKEGCNV